MKKTRYIVALVAAMFAVGAIAGGEAAVGTIAAGAVIGSVHGSLKYAMNN